MKIEKVDVFQIRWSPNDRPSQNSAWVRIQCDGGVCGIGEASPMQGGLASLGIIARDIAPALRRCATRSGSASESRNSSCGTTECGTGNS